MCPLSLFFKECFKAFVSSSLISKPKYNTVSVLYKKWKKEPEQLKELKSKGVRVIYKNRTPKRKDKSLFSKLIKKINPSKSQKKYLEVIDDVKHFNMVVISVGNHADASIIPYTNYLERYQIPYVIIVQLATDLRNLSDTLLTQLIVAYKQAKTVFFVSKENSLKTEIQFGVFLENKSIINNPFFYEQQYTPILTKEFNLACVAAFTSFHKGQDMLIHVLGQEKWKKRDLRVNLYGDGANKQQLIRLIELYKLKETVIIKGFVSDKSTIWKENIGCIMPSRMEGQSLAMLEAMSHGRMIISTKVGDAERLVIDGKTGFLSEALTIELLDSALEEAWQKRSDWEQMGREGREHLYKTITENPVVELSLKLESLL